MRSERAFLRSRLARRIVALFVACALLPLAATALLSYGHVRGLLFEQSYVHLAQLGEAYGSALYERLEAVRRGLRAAAAGAASTRAVGIGIDASELATQLDALTVARPAEPAVALLGAPVPLPELSAAEQTVLARGQAVLRVRVPPGAPAAVMLFEAVDPSRPADGLLAASIRPAYLWGDVEALPAATEFCVLGASDETLFCSHSVTAPEALLRAYATREPRAANGRLQFAAPTGTQVASYRELFLESQYSQRGWTIAAARPESDVLAPIAAYERSFVLAIALAVLAIALVSSVQVRRTLVPLEQLIAGTRRAADRDFATPVDVSSDDEFGELAQSFNAMTWRLGRQFTALSTLAEIDRAILARPDVDLVVEAVLRCILEIVPARCAAVAVHEGGAPDTLRVHVHGRDAHGALVHPRTRCAVGAIRALGTHPGGRWLDPAPPLPAFAEPLAWLGAERIFAIPVIWQGAVVGAIVLGVAAGRDLSDDDHARARDLADRLGVAIAAAAKDEQLYYQAHYDPLTGLPNRLYFRDQLERAVTRARRDGARLAVLFVDLDRFKHVNDSTGHAAGDAVLRDAAERLRRCVRSSDLVARLGGDEFTILLAELRDGDDARVVAANAIAALTKPFVVAGQEHFLSASIGIAVHPDDGVAVEELLRNADTAMYRAKEEGRGRCVFFEERMNAAALSRVRSERELRHALERGEFFLAYQPMLNLRTRRISRAEALVRWRHPQRGVLGPAEFVPLAEETGLIEPLGEWVLRTACARVRALQGTVAVLPAISVNVSARQFRQEALAETIGQVLRATGVPPTALEIEITESLLVDATAETEAMLCRLAAMGVRIALDDFGTGYSSLAYLKRFPVDIVKIDRAFVKDLPADASSAAITSAIVSMAHALRKEVVAEGVATVEQERFLADLGCDHIQGYYLSRPLEAVEFVAFLERAAAGLPCAALAPA